MSIKLAIDSIDPSARGLRKQKLKEPIAPMTPTELKNSKQAKVDTDVKIKYKLLTLGLGLDMPLVMLILILLSVGLVMLFSASYAKGYYDFGDSYYFIKQQGLYALVGVVAMFLISTFNYHYFHKFAYLIYGIAIVLLAILVAGKLYNKYTGGEIAIARPINSVFRWIDIGVSFQPSEIAKFAIVVLFAHIISKGPDRMGKFVYGFLQFILLAGLMAVLIIVEPHVSATIILLIMAICMMVIGGTKLRWFVIFGSILAGIGIGYVAFSGSFDYALERVNSWLNPFPMRDETFQTVQSLYAIGSGQLFGVGLGQSRQKYLWLPEMQNDFIFSVICEELGLVGALIIILLFAMLIWRGIVVSLHAKDRFGMMLGIGITFQVGIQAVLNIAVVTNTVPNTGISLPFFSSGGSSLLMLLAEMGVLLQISRNSTVERT